MKLLHCVLTGVCVIIKSDDPVHFEFSKLLENFEVKSPFFKERLAGDFMRTI